MGDPKTTRLNWYSAKKKLMVKIIVLATLLLVTGYIGMNGRNKQTNAIDVSNGSTESLAQTNMSYGVALSFTLPALNQQQRKAILADIKASGFTEVRHTIMWSEVEAKKGIYNWNRTDQILKDVKDSGLSSVITLSHTPVWARPSECKTDNFCAPSDYTSFAKFSGAAVKRYKDYNIKAWEIWNEPNIVNFWKPLPNSNQYAHLLRATQREIKKSDANATVLLGGLAGNAVDSDGVNYIDPRTYLAQIYASTETGRYFDGVAYHPYVGKRLASIPGDKNGWLKMDTGDNNIRQIMSKNGDEKKMIWLTEFGEATGSGDKSLDDPTVSRDDKQYDSVTPRAQELIISNALVSASKKNFIKNIDFYTWLDRPNLANSFDSGAFYGLKNSDGTKKPGLITIEEFIKLQNTK